MENGSDQRCTIIRTYSNTSLAKSREIYVRVPVLRHSTTNVAPIEMRFPNGDQTKFESVTVPPSVLNRPQSIYSSDSLNMIDVHGNLRTISSCLGILMPKLVANSFADVIQYLLS
ncbi:hypothetical protein AB6A40_001570 [Gnathostoma spinigerum]|uniref:Uncharacterized protein n=1 Tax=Gnathostoma spinigerum TaxID=75299 RepID=A0ABD6EBT4_9BILA